MAQDYADGTASAAELAVELGKGWKGNHQDKPLWTATNDESIKVQKARLQNAMRETAVLQARELWKNNGADLLGNGLNSAGELKRTCVVMYHIDRTASGKDGLGHRIAYSSGVYSNTRDSKLESMRKQANVDPKKKTICGEEQVLLPMKGDERSTMLFSVAFDKGVGLKAACASGCNSLLGEYLIEDIHLAVSACVGNKPSGGQAVAAAASAASAASASASSDVVAKAI